MRTVPPYENSGALRFVSQPIRIALVDDQALVRSGFRMIIEAEEDLKIVGEASDGRGAIALLEEGPIDVMLMDIRMPGSDGLETTKQIVDAGWPVRIIMLTTFDLDEYVFQALRAGASGFLLKDARATELIDAIHAVASGDAIIAPSATCRLMSQLMVDPVPVQADPRLETLTDREREVFLAIANGMTNAEIAEQLHVAEGTVKAHVSHLLQKLERRDRVSLVMLAYDAGLVRR